MGFLKKVNQELDLTDQIESLRPNTKAGIANTKRQFSLFCESEGSSYDDAIEEMKITKNKKDVFKALQSFVNWLTKNGIAHSSIPIYFSHLRTILYYHGIPITDQERKKEIKYPKITEDEKHGLTVEEIKLILETAGRKKKALYLMMLSSGLRIGEAVQLKKQDLELLDGNFMIKVRGNTTKIQKGRTTFMSKEATRLVIPFWKMLDDNKLIFGTNKNPVLATSAEHVRFYDYRKKTGFTKKYDDSKRFHISLHSFRAYFITKVSRHDHNLAKRLAGQKSYLEQYDRMSTKEKLELYKKAEPDLFIYEQKPVPEEIQELKQKLEEIKNQQFEAQKTIAHTIVESVAADLEEWNARGGKLPKESMDAEELRGKITDRLYKQYETLQKVTGKKYKVDIKKIGISKDKMDEYGEKLDAE